MTLPPRAIMVGLTFGTACGSEGASWCQAKGRAHRGVRLSEAMVMGCVGSSAAMVIVGVN
jgi:hypothetical protein